MLVDGTVCPTWDWAHVPDLFSAKTGYPGMNLQIAATLEGALVAVGPTPVHGARHDAHAYAASGLAAVLADHPTLADLGYVGVEGIDTVPYKRFPGTDLNTSQSEFNTALSKARAAVEHAIAHLKLGGCSAKKAAATEHHWKSTRACSRRSSDYSSSRLMNKPPGRS